MLRARVESARWLGELEQCLELILVDAVEINRQFYPK
jgi:hypothetical protein